MWLVQYAHTHARTHARTHSLGSLTHTHTDGRARTCTQTLTHRSLSLSLRVSLSLSIYAVLCLSVCLSISLCLSCVHATENYNTMAMFTTRKMFGCRERKLKCRDRDSPRVLGLNGVRDITTLFCDISYSLLFSRCLC